MVTSVIEDQFRSYWECLPESIRSDLSAQGINYQTHFEDQINRVWIYAHTLFQSSSFYSGHLQDIKGLEGVLDGIVQKDRLPVKESLEGLLVLRSAWDVIDTGNANLSFYKYMSKFMYLFILASGIATVCITVMEETINDSVPSIDPTMTPAGSIIFYLSVATTFFTAFNAYVNPSGRWRQIREATCGLESAIWQYRTRTGPFKMSAQEPDRPTVSLKDAVFVAVDSLSSSDIGQSTSWFKAYPASTFKHGQYRQLPRRGTILDCGCWGRVAAAETLDTVDDHHRPLTPDKYIRFRLRRVMNFYKKRLPAYTRSKNWMSVMLMLITALGTILAYREYTSYVAICATAAAALTSWMEYNSIGKKIGRYNGTVSNLELLILWWNSIPAVDKSVISNIDMLVQMGEQVTLSTCSYTIKISVSKCLLGDKSQRHNVLYKVCIQRNNFRVALLDPETPLDPEKLCLE